MAQNDELILQYIPLVRRIAYRMAERLLGDRDDFVSSGTVGLIKAAQRFDLKKGRSFAAFATPWIRGSIIDDFRRFDALTKEERGKRKKDPQRAEIGRGSHFHAWRDYSLGALARVPDMSQERLREQRDAQLTVAVLMERLPQKLRDVMCLYWFEDMTDPEIGVLYGVSGSRVCQLRRDAERIMRADDD